MKQLSIWTVCVLQVPCCHAFHLWSAFTWDIHLYLQLHLDENRENAASCAKWMEGHQHFFSCIFLLLLFPVVREDVSVRNWEHAWMSACKRAWDGSVRQHFHSPGDQTFHVYGHHKHKWATTWRREWKRFRLIWPILTRPMPAHIR